MCYTVPVNKRDERHTPIRKKEGTNMKKFIALLMLVAILMTATAFAEGAYLGTMTVVNCKNWVTLRASASTRADTVAAIPLGENVDAYARKWDLNIG